jgi:phosphotransferase system enzyme I (PtsI)
MRRGIAVSPGVAIGTVYRVDEVLGQFDPHELNGVEVTEELARLDRAWAAATEALHEMHAKVASQVGETEAEIFHAHEMILHDPSFVAKVREAITKEHLGARAALHRVWNEYTSMFARIKDEYWKERLADVRDVITRIRTHLDEAEDGPKPEGPVILVAQEVMPSQALAFGRMDVAGIVTETGGATSHAAILARSRGIPAVSGVRGILHEVNNGDTVVVDGREGHVIINPGPEVKAAYRKLQREFVHLKDELAHNRDQPAVSADGHHVDLLANINNVADAQAAAAMGAGGVGLFRTEYLFLTHPTVPDEEEQLKAYREVIEASPNRRVTIRTLDLGGDKTVPYLGHHAHRDANPFLGWRSIRLSFEHPEFFQTQLRAILRAACYGQVRILFPMITTLEEMRKVRRLMRRVQQDLDKRNVPYGKEVQLGLMLEVPAAAVAIQNLLTTVDFVSIGSNDHVQYLKAADRDNPKVAHLCQPLSPPVLKVLQSVIGACNRAGVPVTLCGEMAGRPRAFLLLFAMGLRQFSMSAAFIPSIKELLTHLTVRKTRELLDRVLRMKTAGQIQGYLSRQLRDLCPNLAILDSA